MAFAKKTARSLNGDKSQGKMPWPRMRDKTCPRNTNRMVNAESLTNSRADFHQSVCMAVVQATGWECKSCFFVGTIPKLSAISSGYLPQDY